MRLGDKKIFFYETIYKIILVYFNPGFLELSSRLKRGFLYRFPPKALSFYFRPFSEDSPKVHLPIPIFKHFKISGRGFILAFQTFLWINLIKEFIVHTDIEIEVHYNAYKSNFTNIHKLAVKLKISWAI